MARKGNDFACPHRKRQPTPEMSVDSECGMWIDTWSENQPSRMRPGTWHSADILRREEAFDASRPRVEAYEGRKVVGYGKIRPWRKIDVEITMTEGVIKAEYQGACLSTTNTSRVYCGGFRMCAGNRGLISQNAGALKRAYAST
jgi:hypothetical protein